MEDFKHLSDEQVAAFLEGKENISETAFLNEMIQDPVLDAVVDIFDNLSEIEELDELEEIQEDITI